MFRRFSRLKRERVAAGKCNPLNRHFGEGLSFQFKIKHNRSAAGPLMKRISQGLVKLG